MRNTMTEAQIKFMDKKGGVNAYGNPFYHDHGNWNKRSGGIKLASPNPALGYDPEYFLSRFQQRIIKPAASREHYDEFWNRHDDMARELIPIFRHYNDKTMQEGHFDGHTSRVVNQNKIVLDLLSKEKDDPRYAWSEDGYFVPYSNQTAAKIKALANSINSRVFQLPLPASGSSPAFVDYAAKLARARPPPLLNLPDNVILDLVSLMDCSEILKLRVLSKDMKTFLNQNIATIYARMRKLEPLLPTIKFDGPPAGHAESPVERELRVQNNFLRFRNACRFSEKVLDFSEIKWGGTPGEAWKTVTQRLGPAMVRDDNYAKTPINEDYQRRWWRYLIYVKNGLDHRDAQQLAVASPPVPVDKAKSLNEWPYLENPLMRSRYIKVLLNGPVAFSTFAAVMKQKEDQAADQGIPFDRQSALEAAQSAALVEPKTQWPLNTAGMDAYNPRMTEHQLLALIKLEYMNTDKLAALLTQLKIPGRSKLTNYEARYNKLAEFIRAGRLPLNFNIDAKTR
jgi:hypothetical protein